jgi:hypothetical protein
MNLLLWFLERPLVIWFLTTRPATWLLERILVHWELNDDFIATDPNSIKCIFLVSYAATEVISGPDCEGELTHGSRFTTLLAKDLAERYPTAWIIGGEFSKNSPCTTEWQDKLKLLPPDRCINVGPVSSSTDETEAMIEAAHQKVISIDNSIVVFEGAHSRRDKVIWEFFAPFERLFFKSVSAKLAADPRNPIAAQRIWQVWLVANLIAFPFFKLLPGVGYFAKKNFSQPVS